LNGLVWLRLVWLRLVWLRLVWFGYVWFGYVWFGYVWFGYGSFGLVWEECTTRSRSSVEFICCVRVGSLSRKNVFHDAFFFFMLLAFSRTSTALAGGGLSPRG